MGLSAALAPLANAGVTVTDVKLPAPEDVEVGKPSTVAVTVENTEEEAVGFTLELIRTFTATLDLGDELQEGYNYFPDFNKTLLASVEANVEPGQTVVEVPVEFAIGGDYDLQVTLTLDGADEPEVVLPLAEPLQVPVERPATAVYDLTVQKEALENGVGTCWMFPNQLQSAGEQIIYPGKLITMPRSGTLYGLTWYYQKSDFPSANLRVRVLLKECDPEMEYFEAATDRFTDSQNFTLVFDGMSPEFSKSDEDTTPWTINFQRGFHYDNSKNLVVLVETTAYDSGYYRPYIRAARLSEVVDEEVVRLNCGVYTYWWGDRNYFDATGKYVLDNDMPVTTFSYALDPVAAVCDMAVGEITSIPEDIKAEQEATFRVEVENAGTSTVDTFSLELLDMTEDPENPVVLTTAVFDDDSFAPESTGIKRIRYAFPEAGSYELAIRIVAEGDTDDSNNTTTPFLFTVGEKSGVTAVGAGSDLLGYSEGVIGVNVADAVSLDVYGVDGACVKSVALHGASEVALDLPAGLYVASVKDAEGRACVMKFIVK